MSGITGVYDGFLFSFLRVLHTDHQSNWTNLQSHQQWVKVNFPQIHSNVCCCLAHLGHFAWDKNKFEGCFDLIPYLLDTSNIFLRCFLVILFLLLRISCSGPKPSVGWIIYFWLFVFWVLCICWILIPCQIDSKHSLQFCELSLHSINSFFICV